MFGSDRAGFRARRIALVSALVAVLLTLISVAAFAQSAPSDSALIAGMEAQGQVMGSASTGCIAGVDSAVTIFRSDLAPMEREQLEVHERVHRKQIADTMRADSTLDCFTAFWALTASPMANLLAEVPAYRAQAAWLAEHTQGFDPARFYEYWAKNLFFAYEKRLAYQYILGFLQSGIAPSVQPMPEGLVIPIG
jgi:hypothetical protein